MLTKFLKRFNLPQNQLDELKELYLSMSLRSLAMSMSGIFIPIFLFHLNYKIWQILFYFFCVFITQYIFAIPAAKIVGKIGPKHTILISYLLQTITLLGLIYLKTFSFFFVPSAILLGLANVCFFTSYHIDFSKVKHQNTGGSELGLAYVSERFGAFIGPILGGLIAFIFAPKYIFIFSIVILLLAAVPLFSTKEPTRLNQELHYGDFNLASIKQNIAAYSFFTVETAVSMIIWPMFLGIFILGDSPYLKLGGILSASIIISFVAAKFYGKLIDNSHGRNVLRFGAIFNSALHFVRVFVSGFFSALAINFVNEVVTPAYRMAMFKGMYTQADNFPGHRIVYISIMEVFSSLSRALFFGVAAIAAYYFQAEKGFFAVLFTIGAISSLLIMLEKYEILKSTKLKLWPLKN